MSVAEAAQAATLLLERIYAAISWINPVVASPAAVPPAGEDYAPQSRISFDDARALRRHVAAAVAVNVAGAHVAGAHVAGVLAQ